MKQANAAKVRNQAVKADFRGKVKTVKKELAANGKNIEADLSKAIQAIDKAAKRGVIHKKAADRRKSRLMLAINKSLKKPVEAKSIKDPALKGQAAKKKSAPVKKETVKKSVPKAVKKTTTTKSNKTTKKASK